jgi:outer membrane protein assembly factor BamB
MPPSAPAPRRGASGAQIALIIAAVVALLLAVGGTVLLVSGSDEKSPTAEGENGGNQGGRDEGEDGGGEVELPAEPVNATLGWSTPVPEVTAEEFTMGARGSWVTDEHLVRTLDDAITAYDLQTGEEAWSLPLELSGGDCNASPTASDNRIAVLQGRDCEELTVIDIAAGEELRSIPIDLDMTGGALSDDSFPAVLGDTIALGWGTGGAGYSMSSGEQLWKSTSTEENCPEVSYAVFGDTFVSQRACGFVGDEGGRIRATTEDGDELWEWEYGPEHEGQKLTVHSVVSVEPLVVTAWLDDDYEKETIFVIDEDHQEIAHTLDYDIERYQSPCMINTLIDCKMSVVHDGFLYLASQTPGTDNAVVAFDLSSGQPLYEVEPFYEEGTGPVNGSATEIRPFAVQDGQILAYQRDTFDDTKAGMVVAIDPAAEEATPVMHLDPAATDQEAAAGSPSDPQELRLIWHENTLLMITETIYEPSLEDREATLVFR